jgi:hypothetical protein
MILYNLFMFMLVKGVGELASPVVALRPVSQRELWLWR